MTHFATPIFDETAWERGKAARILWNTRKGWIKADPSREELCDWLTAEAWDKPDSFLGKMAENLETWGRLTPKMEEAVRKIRDERVTKAAEWKAKREAEAAASNFIGTVGEKRNFTATVSFKTSVHTRFGLMHITGLKEGDNIIIHKGRDNWPERGTTVTFTATIKKHEDFKGAKETIVTRPSKIKTKGE